jgi:hypothetical protein
MGSTSDPTGLVISYGTLNQAATDIGNLAPESSRISNSVRTVGRSTEYLVPGLVNDDDYDLGPLGRLATALAGYYANWSTDIANAMDGLNKLGGYFKGVADAFAETDMSQAAALNEGAMMSAILQYSAQLDLYNEEVANGGGRNGVAAPVAPVPVTSPFSLPGTSGVSTTFTLGGADPFSAPGTPANATPNDLVTSETTTVTADGLTYTETTTLDPDQGWGPNGPTQDSTQVIHNLDGSTDTVTTTVNTSGSGTMTDMGSSTGNTTTYTRSSWTADWVAQTAPAASTSPPSFKPR